LSSRCASAGDKARRNEPACRLSTFWTCLSGFARISCWRSIQCRRLPTAPSRQFRVFGLRSLLARQSQNDSAVTSRTITHRQRSLRPCRLIFASFAPFRGQIPLPIKNTPMDTMDTTGASRFFPSGVSSVGNGNSTSAQKIHPRKIRAAPARPPRPAVRPSSLPPLFPHSLSSSLLPPPPSSHEKTQFQLRPQTPLR